MTTQGDSWQGTVHAQQLSGKWARIRRTTRAHGTVNFGIAKCPPPWKTYLSNRPLTGRSCSGALDRATKRADESRQRVPTALPDVSSPSKRASRSLAV
jgi:hypothetical protein